LAENKRRPKGAFWPVGIENRSLTCIKELAERRTKGDQGERFGMLLSKLKCSRDIGGEERIPQRAFL